MAHKPPRIWGEWVYDSTGRRLDVRLDTPSWFNWLTLSTTTSFSYPLHDHARGYIAGFMTVRKEARQRGGSYWVAFRRGAGRVRKVYLGRPAAVTRQRLETVAAALLDGHPGDGTKRDDY